MLQNTQKAYVIYSKQWFGLLGDRKWGVQWVSCSEDAIVSAPPLFSPPHGSFHYPPKLPPSPASASSHVPQLQLNSVIPGMKVKSGRGVGREHEETSWQDPTVQRRGLSDEEDDALGDHDLVVVLHLAQRSLDLL